MKPQDFQQLSGHVADLTKAGLPLAAGLRALAADVPNRRLFNPLLRMVTQLEAGADLATVLKSHGTPLDLCALIDAGMRTGRMELVLQQYAECVQAANDVRQRTRIALAYPALVLAMGAALCLLILTVIVPEFVPIFEGFGVELPVITKVLVECSLLVRQQGGWIVLLLLPFSAGLWLALRIEPIRVQVQSLVYRLPLIGPLLRWTAMARFSHLLALLLENQVPLPGALLLAGAGDAPIHAACRRLASEVEAGRPLVTAARDLNLFPATFLQAWAGHHQGGGVPESLHALGDMFQQRSRMQAALITLVAEPVAVLSMGVFVSLVVVALFLPLINLLNDLS